MDTRAPAAGWQIAFFTLALNLLCIPIALAVAKVLPSTLDVQTLARLLTLLAGGGIIAAFPRARHAALRYLRKPMGFPRSGEIVALMLVNALLSFAIAGGIVAWHIATHGPMELTHDTNPAEQLRDATSTSGLLFLFAAVIVAPVIEELAFRGFMFDAWERRWGWFWSAMMTSTVFALYHPHFFAAFSQSILLVSARRRAGALRGAICVHAFGNLILWYPLLGQYVLPRVDVDDQALLRWAPHLCALALALLVVPAYFVFAGKNPADAGKPI